MENVKVVKPSALLAGLVLIGWFTVQAQSPSTRFSISGVVQDALQAEDADRRR